MDDDKRHEVALFRYQVIASLLALRPGEGRLKAAILELARRPFVHPSGKEVFVGFSTIEHWLAWYRRFGFDGLLGRPRIDRGASRTIPEPLAAAIEALLRDRPWLSGPTVLAELQARGLLASGELSLTTFYRFRKARGLERVPRRESKGDHRAFEFEYPGDCYQCDVSYGPRLAVREGVRRRTYLYAVIDDATRVVAHAQFYFAQHLENLKDTLKQAFRKRGLCRRLYVDNAMIFRSRLVLSVAARLGIDLIHSRPFRPEGRGKVEKWFRRVEDQFLARVDIDRVSDIDMLNRLLWAWVEGEYHVAVHRGIGEPPLDRWMRLASYARPLPADCDLDRLFLQEARRRIAKDGTLTILGKRFEAPPHLAGMRVTILYDPFDLRSAIARTPEGREYPIRPLDKQANRHAKRSAEPATPDVQGTIPLVSLEKLAEEHEHEERKHEEERDET